jgi:hypothetical protein
LLSTRNAFGSRPPVGLNLYNIRGRHSSTEADG